MLRVPELRGPRTVPTRTAPVDGMRATWWRHTGARPRPGDCAVRGDGHRARVEPVASAVSSAVGVAVRGEVKRGNPSISLDGTGIADLAPLPGRR